MKIKIWIPTLLLAVAFTSLAHSQLFSRKNARVLTNAWASPEFEEKRMGDDGPIPMTYHFFEGKYHGGNIRDKSLETFPLQQIVETLAADMKAQNFFPAPSTEEGDLLILVQWGVTEIEDDWSEMFPEDSSDVDAEIGDDGVEIESSSDGYEFYGNNMSQTRRNAVLTGIDKALYKKGLTPSEEYDLRALLDEERYFIVLVAFDWQLLLKEKKKEVQFITRFSLPSIGTNFTNAVPSLSRAAIPHIGTNLDDLNKTKTQLGWGKGTVGELEVIGEVDEAELQEITGPKNKKEK